MQIWVRRSLVSLAVACAAAGVAACSGNMGSGVGGGLPVPQAGAQGYQQPNGPTGASSSSRQRVVEGAVFVTSDLRSIPLPDVDGFGLSLSLASPAPAVSAVPSGTVPQSSASPRSLLQKVSRVVVVAQVAASPEPSASAAVPFATGGPAAAPSATAAPSPGAASPRPAKSAAASPRPSSSPPKVDTKLVVYPDYEPDAPTPQPSGNVQTFAKRKAIVQGYISPAVVLELYGLAAARFTIPAAEQVPNRGYTIAIFTAGKKHKQQLIASDPAATLAGSVVSSALTTPIALKKGTGYDIVLYGDELAATPAPVASGYPTPGSNPFVTPLPSGYPQAPGQPYPGQGYPGATPFPGQTAYPGQTPFPGQPTPYPGATFTPYPGH